MTEAELLDYYERRAAEYERIYDRPARRSDLGRIEELLAATVAGRRIVEVACGTGYWTRRIARTGANVVATDAAAAVLELARRQPLGPAAVRFARADASCLPFRADAFDGLLAAFWWSHVARRSLAAFLSEVRRVLAPGAVGIFVDNRYVEGSSTPIATRDDGGDSWQERTLADGTRCAVRKNFPDAPEVRAALEPFARSVEIIELEYAWLAIARRWDEKSPGA